MKKVRLIASVMALALTVTSVCVYSGEADAAKSKKVSLKKRASVTVGKTVKLKVKNGNKKAKVTWKSSKSKIAKITKKTTKGNKATATVKGIKEGTSTITATYKLGKKKTKLTCKVTVGAAQDPVVPVASTAPAQPTVAPTTQTTTGPEPTKGADQTQTAAPTSSPTKKPVTVTKAPTPEPTPYLINPYTVNLSDPDIIVEEEGFGANPSYNPETGALECKDWLDVKGFIVLNPAVERADEYKYVEVTYLLEGNPDISLYLGNQDLEYNVGQNAGGWSPEIKIAENGIGKEVTVCYGAKKAFGDDTSYIKGLKFFNYRNEEGISISIKDITYYMDGKKSKPEDFVAHTLEEKEVTIDGVASEDEEWLSAKEYRFTSKIPLSSGDGKTDTSGTVRFMHDEDNLYFFVDVKDSSIDDTSNNNYERDGLEILFDEDNCKKDGSGSADWTENKDGFHYRFTGLNKASEVKTGLSASTDDYAGGGVDGKGKYAVEVKYALTDKGYSVEGKIPFANKKKLGDKVSMDLIIQDCKDGVRNNEIYLYNTEEAKNYWNNESAAFGTVVLGKKTESTEPTKPAEPTEPEDK